MTKKKTSWQIILTVLGMLIWVGASVIVAQLVIGNLLIILFGAEVLNQTVGMTGYSALSYLLAMALIVLLPTAIKKNRQKLLDFKELGLQDWPTWKDIGLAPVAYIIYLILGSGLVMLFSLLPWFNAEETQNIGFSLSIMGWERILAFVSLVVIAPIAEEIIFRGWLYGKLRKNFAKRVPEWVGMLLSILLVSILFGAIHLQWNVGVNVFALSVVLCLLREITGTIHAGILLHMIKNGVAFYLLFVLGIS